MTDKQKRNILDAMFDILDELDLRCDECYFYKRISHMKGICEPDNAKRASWQCCGRWLSKNYQPQEEEQ